MEKTDLLKAIEYISTLEDGWNGYFAQKPSNLSIDAAKKFISLLPKNKLNPNKISPGGERSVTLEWQMLGINLLLNFDGDYIHFSREEKNRPTIFKDNIPFGFVKIPDKIMKLIPNTWELS
ncbi:MAG: hypothetical protein AB7F19_07810 [Candidatus Babeliales bacterium]